MFLAQIGMIGFPERTPTDVPYTQYTPTFGGFSVSPTVVARYANYGGIVHLWVTATAHGTSNAGGATSLTFTLPASLGAATGVTQSCICEVTVNNGARGSGPGMCLLTPGTTTATVYRDSTATATWTASGNKSFNLSILYEAYNYTTFVPAFTGFDTDPLVTARFISQFGRCHYYLNTNTDGMATSTLANAVTITLPIASANTVTQYCPITVIKNNNARQALPGMIKIPPNSTTATIYRDSSEATVWTLPGSQARSFNFSIVYETV